MRVSRLCALLLCALFAVSAFAADADSQPVPRFRGKTLSGETFNNESVKGKVIPLEFWTRWCPYCRDEEALVEMIDREFASQGLIVLAIDFAESKKTVKKCLDQHPRACRIVLTEDTNLAAMYQAILIRSMWSLIARATLRVSSAARQASAVCVGG